MSSSVPRRQRQSFFCLRISLAFVCSYVEARFYRAIVENVNDRVGRYFLFAMLLSAGMWNASTGEYLCPREEQRDRKGARSSPSLSTLSLYLPRRAPYFVLIADEAGLLFLSPPPLFQPSSPRRRRSTPRSSPIHSTSSRRRPRAPGRLAGFTSPRSPSLSAPSLPGRSRSSLRCRSCSRSSSSEARIFSLPTEASASPGGSVGPRGSLAPVSFRAYSSSPLCSSTRMRMVDGPSRRSTSSSTTSSRRLVARPTSTGRPLRRSTLPTCSSTSISSSLSRFSPSPPSP